MGAYACYRLPGNHHYVRVEQTSGKPEELMSATALNGRKGFVFAPFCTSKTDPLLLIRPDVTENIPLPTGEEQSTTTLPTEKERAGSTPSGGNREAYHTDFHNFHAQLLTGTFSKIVLSRCADMTLALPPVEKAGKALFLRACAAYPHLFVSLVSTPQSGTWLMATPETLLEGDGTRWHTVALAGTMTLRADEPTPTGSPTDTWNAKNLLEQRYVATYIVETLERFADEIAEQGPDTVRAGNLAHLRSDFAFTLPTTTQLGTLLQALHPTPAVCGLPKQKAMDFIVHNEQQPRHYYSGFAGPLFPDEETHLYVSLRCMQLLPGGCRLYAGGGLMPESNETQEWQETEAKMDTMRNLFGPPNTPIPATQHV